jgi:hypothetical protein
MMCTYCSVYTARLLMMDRETVRNIVEFYSKNKFEKLVHLVDFIIRIYHDARSSECQIRRLWSSLLLQSPATICSRYDYAYVGY